MLYWERERDEDVSIAILGNYSFSLVCVKKSSRASNILLPDDLVCALRVVLLSSKKRTCSRREARF